MSWFVQNSEPPTIAPENELLDDSAIGDSLASEDEEEGEKIQENRSRFNRR